MPRGCGGGWLSRLFGEIGVFVWDKGIGMPKSEFFRCPNCNGRIQKTAQAWVLGEASRAVVLGECKPTYCPFCGREIDTQAIVDGKYDDRPGSILGCLAYGAALGGVYWWLRTKQDFSELSAFILSVALVLAGAFALAGLVHLFGRRGK